MKQRAVLITGSSGLVGSQSVAFFAVRGWTVYGIDNNSRMTYFGREASTAAINTRLLQTYPSYRYYNFDIRNEKKVSDLIKTNKFDLIVHAAAQPSHDWSALYPLIDFSVNTIATVNILQAVKQYAKDTVCIFLSTNKVYGDNPNHLPFISYAHRYDLPKNHPYYQGIPESMSIDQTMHSIFGASKCAADIMAQEYGRYFGLPIGVFRCGCLTGPLHAATSQHGFLAYLVKRITTKKQYTIIGYHGFQVRDMLHVADLVPAFYEFYKSPRPGEVYNMGGSRTSNVSIMEAIRHIEQMTGIKAITTYQNKPRKGDHKWYISDISKFRRHYPKWDITYTTSDIISDLVNRRAHI
jgi:CDP-paratose 2-epimerase